MIGLDSATSERLCLTLLHSLWQVTLLAAIAWGVGLALGRRRDNASYLVHVAALMLGLTAAPITYTALSSEGVVLPTAELPTAPINPTAEPIASALPPTPVLIAVEESAAPPAAIEIPPAVTPVEPLTPPFAWRSVVPWLAGVYLAGVALMLARLARSALLMERLRSAAQPVLDGPAFEALAELGRRWSLKVTPALAQAEQVVVPKVVGLLKPTILLPSSALTGLSVEDLELILAHELAHVRRHDLWVNLLQRLGEAVLFFNPAVWWLSRRVSMLREYCCDQHACQAVPEGVEPRLRYATALLRAVEIHRPGSGSQVTSLAAAGRSPSELRRRVARLFGEPLGEPVRLTRGGALAAAGALLLLAAPHFAQSQSDTGGEKSPSSRPSLAELLDQFAEHEQAYLPYTLETIDTFRVAEGITEEQRERFPWADGRLHQRRMEYGQLDLTTSLRKEVRLYDGQESPHRFDQYRGGERLLNVSIDESGHHTVRESKEPLDVQKLVWAEPLFGVFPLSAFGGGGLLTSAVDEGSVKATLDWDQNDAKLSFAYGPGSIRTRFSIWLSADHNWHPIRLERRFQAGRTPCYSDWEATELALDTNAAGGWRVAAATASHSDLGDQAEEPLLTDDVVYSVDFKILAARYGDEVTEEAFEYEVPEGATFKPDLVEYDQPESQADRLVAEARARTFGLSQVPKILFRGTYSGGVVPAMQAVSSGGIDQFWKARTLAAERNVGKQTLLAWDGDRLLIEDRYPAKEHRKKESVQAHYWDGQEGWIGETYSSPKNVYRYAAADKLFEHLQAGMLPRWAAAGGRLLWPGPEVALQAIFSEATPELTRYSLAGEETLDGSVCRVFEGPARMEKIWIDKRSGLIKAVCQHSSGKDSWDLDSEALRVVAGRSFADFDKYRQWLDKQTEETQAEIRAHWAEWNWETSEPFTMSVFSDYREIAPGVSWPMRCEWITGHGVGREEKTHKFYRHEISTTAVETDFSMTELAANALPQDGVKVTDRRFKENEIRNEFYYEWSTTLSEAEIDRLREEKLAKVQAKQAEKDRINATPINSVNDAIQVLTEGPKVDPPKVWARALKYLADRPEEAFPAVIAALDSEERDHPISKLSFALRAIGDARAVPALIRALSRTLQPSRSDYGLIMEDPELCRFMQKHDNGRDGGKYFTYGRAFREVVCSLRRLTGKQFNEMELNGIDFEGTEIQRRLAREQFDRVAKTWADWWEANWRDHVEDPAYGKVNLRAEEAAPAQLLVARVPPSGPHVELIDVSSGTFRSVHNGGSCFIDLDTRRELGWPAELPALGKTRLDSPKLLAWARREGIDLVGITHTPAGEGEPLYCLMPLDLRAWKITEEEHRRLPDMVRGKEPYPLNRPVDLLIPRREIPKPRDPDHSGDSFLFVTREGTAGVLRLTAQVIEAKDVTGQIAFVGNIFQTVGYHRGVRYSLDTMSAPAEPERAAEEIGNAEAKTEAEWGKPADGLQARVIPRQASWSSGEAPAFDIEVRALPGVSEYTLPRVTRQLRVEIDGEWHNWRGGMLIAGYTGGRKDQKGTSPAWRPFHKPLILDESWGRDWEIPESLHDKAEIAQTDFVAKHPAPQVLTPGKHTVRVGVMGELVTQAVEIEVAGGEQKPEGAIDETSRTDAALSQVKKETPLPEGVAFRINLVDDTTGKPVLHAVALHQKDAANWDVVTGEESFDPDQWTPSAVTEGKFDAATGIAFLRFYATGYEPIELEGGALRSQAATRSVRMKPLPPVRLTITSPDGSPAAGAKLEGLYPYIYRLNFRYEGRRRRVQHLLQVDAVSDENGQITFARPALGDLARYRVLHESGHAELRMAEVERGDTGLAPRLSLEPYATIQGRLLPKLQDNEFLEVYRMKPNRQQIDGPAEIVHPAADGSFRVPKRLSGWHSFVHRTRLIPSGGAGSRAIASFGPFHVKSGQTLDVTLGNEGLGVVGKLNLPSNPSLDFTGLQIWTRYERDIPFSYPHQPRGLSEDEQRAWWDAYWGSDRAANNQEYYRRHITVPVSPDGSFHFASLPPGKYELLLNHQFWDRNRPRLKVTNPELVVPDRDLGTVLDLQQVKVETQEDPRTQHRHDHNDHHHSGAHEPQQSKSDNSPGPNEYSEAYQRVVVEQLQQQDQKERVDLGTLDDEQVVSRLNELAASLGQKQPTPEQLAQAGELFKRLLSSKPSAEGIWTKLAEASTDSDTEKRIAAYEKAFRLQGIVPKLSPAALLLYDRCQRAMEAEAKEQRAEFEKWTAEQLAGDLTPSQGIETWTVILLDGQTGEPLPGIVLKGLADVSGQQEPVQRRFTSGPGGACRDTAPHVAGIPSLRSRMVLLR